VIRAPTPCQSSDHTTAPHGHFNPWSSWSCWSHWSLYASCCSSAPRWMLAAPYQAFKFRLRKHVNQAHPLSQSSKFDRMYDFASEPVISGLLAISSAGSAWQGKECNDLRRTRVSLDMCNWNSVSCLNSSVRSPYLTLSAAADAEQGGIRTIDTAATIDFVSILSFRLIVRTSSALELIAAGGGSGRRLRGHQLRVNVRQMIRTQTGGCRKAMPFSPNF
jgi:hypothetical protein